MSLTRVEVKNPVGINTSVVSGDLPLPIWSDGGNVSFKNGKVTKAQGYAPVLEYPNPVLGLLPYLQDSVPYWFMGTSEFLVRTEGGTPVNVSRPVGGPYTATLDNPWDGGILHQVAIMNNGLDLPQAYSPQVGLFVNLPNWTATHRCAVMRPFKNYLVALDVTKNSERFPTLVKWSSPADPGQVPFSWNEADPTNDAGETSLADTSGAIVDGAKLRDYFIIYKEDSVYLMRYIGGVFVFAFQQLFNDVGILARRCVAEFDGSHFVVGIGDVYVHNGVQKRSVIDGVNKERLFQSIRPDAIDKTFVVADHNRSEMWVCYPSFDSVGDFCDKAMVWNWKENTWAFRDVPDVFCAASGILDPQIPDNWDADGAAWDTDESIWSSASYNPAKASILISSPSREKVYALADVSLFDGASFTSFVQRTGVYMDDNRNLKSVHAVIPHVYGSGPGAMYIGTSKTQQGAIEWRGPYLFDIGEDYKVDCKKVGRYLSIRFEFPSTSNWTLNGYTVEVTPTAGMR